MSKTWTDQEVWTFTRLSVLRALYGAIEPFEIRGEDNIPIDWLRDYADDIAETYPTESPKRMISEDNVQGDLDN